MDTTNGQGRKGFEAFYKEHFPAVFLFLKHYAGDEALAEDLAQETFTRILERKIPLERCDRGYLYTMARNLYLHHRRHEEVEERYAAELSEEEADDYDFLKEVTRQETYQALYAAIKQLPPRTREVIELQLSGKSNAEVAEEMDISLNTVKDLKKGAYATLRELLSKDYFLLLTAMLGECL